MTDGMTVVAGDFFAVLWDIGVPAQAETAARVNAALASSCSHLDLMLSAVGLQFYGSRANPAGTIVKALGGCTCLVYGTIFRRSSSDAADTPPRHTDLSREELARILE